MLAAVVLVQKILGHAEVVARQLKRMVVHLSDNLQDLGRLHSLSRRVPPGEGAVLPDEHRRNGIGVDPLVPEGPDDDMPCVFLIGPLDFLLGLCLGHRDCAAEGVGMGRAKGLDGNCRLSERHRP